MEQVHDSGPGADAEAAGASPGHETGRDQAGGLLEQDLHADPFTQVSRWLREADDAASGTAVEPRAFSVATVDTQGRPDVRVVILRVFDEAGPGFVTGRGAAKSAQLDADPGIAATMTWPMLNRAIRFRGTARELPSAPLDDYWRTPSRAARIAAWIGPQSAPAGSREALERAWGERDEQWRGRRVTRPDDLRGWQIRCEEIELWAGRADHLHDRLVYLRVGDGPLDDASSWRIERRLP